MKSKLRISRLSILRVTSLTVVLFSVVSCVSLKRVIDEPVFIVGGYSNRASLNCSSEFEAVPSAVLFPRADIAWFAGLGFNRFTYAKGTWDNWSIGDSTNTDPGFSVPVNSNDQLNIARLGGDAWTTYSKSKNLAYFYFVGRKVDNSSCIAVAATTPEKLQTNDWDFPAVCVLEERADQGAILNIDATNTFYTVSKFDNLIKVRAFDNCSGAPGPTYGCPFTAEDVISGANGLQFSISENPCTSNLILAYRKNEEIRLRFYDENLTVINEYRVRENQPFENGQTNVNCYRGTIRRCGMGTADCCDSPDCNDPDDGNDTCLRVNGRPSIDTYMKDRAGTKMCGAVVAYDALIKGEDGNDWAKSRLDIVDISDESNPSSIAKWNSTDNEFTWNQYMSYAVVSDFGPNEKSPKIAWFWLTDIRGPCNVIAEGATSINLGNSMQATGIISGPFPAPALSANGIGDYFRGVKGGDKDGALLVSWGEPIRTSANCKECKGESYNLSTKITRIHWERNKVKNPGPIDNTAIGPVELKASRD